MKNQYFLKDKKAMIYKSVAGKIDQYGRPERDKLYPIAHAPIWCYSSQLSQQDTYSAAAYGEKETRYFVFNYYKNIAVYDMILYRGEWYRITRVDHKDDYNGETFIYVQNAVGGWRPSEDQIQPYNADIWK